MIKERATKKRENTKAVAYGQGREAILNAAQELFTSRGYKETSLKELGEKSGTNSALISYYFGNKRGLMKAVLQNRLVKFNKIFKPVEELGNKVSIDDFLNSIDLALEAFKSDPAYFNINQWNYMCGGMFAKEIHEEVCSTAEERIAATIMKINPSLDKTNAMIRVLMIGSLLTKYSELCWHYPKFRKFSASNSQMQSGFRDSIRLQIRSIIQQA